jgi:hypothetical protein
VNDDHVSESVLITLSGLWDEEEEEEESIYSRCGLENHRAKTNTHHSNSYSNSD